MAELKIVINDPKTGKSYQKTLEDHSLFLNKKINDKISGNDFNLENYELQITGGSDKSGFPMRRDLPGTAKKRLLLTDGPGITQKRKGQRVKKTIAPNQVTENTAQLNLKIIKYGSKSVEEYLGIEKKEEKKPETKEKKRAPEAKEEKN